MEASNLQELKDAATELMRFTCNSCERRPDDGRIVHPLYSAIIRMRNALSANSIRNCDVGTAEEQAQRFHDFCVGNSSGINGMCKPTCPCIDCFDKCQCFAKWSQMPYEAQEGGAK